MGVATSNPILNLLKSVLLKSLLKHVSEEKSVGVAGRLFQHGMIRLQNKNSSGDAIPNVNFYAVRPEATRIR